jgi:prevent-host-death family protein
MRRTEIKAPILRENFFRFVARAERGEEFDISRRGRVIAVLMPIELKADRKQPRNTSQIVRR